MLEVETKNSKFASTGGPLGKPNKPFCYHQNGSGNDNEQNCLSCKEKAKDLNSFKEADIPEFDFEENFDNDESVPCNVPKVKRVDL